MPASADCYLLCIMMALDTEITYFLNLNGRHKFSFYSYIRELGKHARSVVYLSTNLLNYAIKYLYD